MIARHVAPTALALLVAGCTTREKPADSATPDSVLVAPVSPAMAPAVTGTDTSAGPVPDSARPTTVPAKPVTPPPAVPRPTSAKPATPPAKIAVGDSVGHRIIGRDSAMEWPVGGRPGRTLPDAPAPRKQTP